MRVLGVGDHCDLGDLYQRLIARGHDVRVRIGEAESRDVFLGLVPRATGSLDDELAWVRGDPKGLVLFEGVDRGELQDRLRREGVRVIGGSAMGDRLESDRDFGQRTLASLGLPVAPAYEVAGFDEAVAFVTQRPGRYVLKFSGSGFASTRSYVGVLDSGADMLAMLETQRSLWPYPDETPRIVLMTHLTGVEVGVGAFFDGRAFLGPPNIDWEHKRFFPGDLGELTGEMGTVVSYRGGERLFDATLARAAPLLREAGHVGYVNLNMIVDDRGTWPLELTCRFGYPGFPILSELHVDPWDRVFEQLLSQDETPIRTYDGFAVGVVITVPPFPYHDGYPRLSKGMPICFREDTDADDHASFHYGEVALRDGRLVTAGQIGYVVVVTGRGDTVEAARQDAYGRVDKLVIPNGRYRNDIGGRLMSSGLRELSRLGWWE